MMVVMRYRERDTHEVVKVDCDLSNGAVETSLTTFARVAKAEQRLEECLQRSQSEAGLADYAGRHWTGWHHHQTLSFIATWFLVTETRRGKKMDTGDDVAPDSRRHRVDPSLCVSMRDHATLTA
jgi:SRSO17 transposase